MIQINLLPVREERRKAGIRQLAILLAATLVGSLVLVAAVYWKQGSDIDKAQKQLVATQTEIDGYKEQLAQVDKLKETQARIEKKLSVIESLDRSRSGPVRMLDELATHSPERLWLTRVTADGTQLTIQGKSLDNELVAGFLTALEDSPYFTQVELRRTEAERSDGLKLNVFEVTAAIVSPSEAQQSAAAAFAPVVAGR